MGTILTNLEFWYGLLTAICVLVVVAGVWAGFALAYDVGSFWED